MTSVSMVEVHSPVGNPIDLVDIALSECERFYPAFQLVIWGGKPAEEAMATAMIEPIGEA